jgi:hypothetical protein
MRATLERGFQQVFGNDPVLTLRILAGRIIRRAASWAIVIGVLALLGTGLEWLTHGLPTPWLPAIVAAVPFALFVGLRLAVVQWPALAGWLAWHQLVGPIGLFEAVDLPDHLDVLPNPDAAFRHPEAVRQQVACLTERGFVDVGTFDVHLTEHLPTVLLAHPAEQCWANLFEAERGRWVVEFVTPYADGTSVAFTNDRDRGLDPMPGRHTVRYRGADPLVVWDHCLAERPPGARVPVEPAATVAEFERYTAQWLVWRKERGFTPRERGMMAAPLITWGLTILTIGTAYLTVLGVLASAGLLALAGSAASWWMLFLPVLVAGALAPFLLLVPAVRRRAGSPPAAARPDTPPASEVAAEPVVTLTREPVLERWFGNGNYDQPLRTFGFRRVGTFISSLGMLSLSVRSSDGVYAVVWCPDTRPWLEVVAAGADGAHYRAAPLGAGAGGGSLTIDRSAGVEVLEPRCLALVGSAPRAALRPETVAAVLQAHLAADATWRLEVATAAHEAAEADRAAHRLSWRHARTLVTGLWWLWPLALIGVLHLLESAGRWDPDGLLSSGRLFGVWIVAMIGGCVVWPWLRSQLYAARDEAGRRSEAAGHDGAGS